MRRLNAVGMLACVVLAGCTSTSPGGASTASPAPAPCRTDVLANWRTQGLAVLWVGQPDTGPTSQVAMPSAVAAMDVRNGRIRSYCPLPPPVAGAAVQQPYSLAMRQGGTEYPRYVADIDLMLRTQWFSPDFRWFGAPGLPLVDVAAGRAVPADLAGTLVGVGRDVALVRSGTGPVTSWCARSLPPTPGQPCTRLRPPAGQGAFVINAAGVPGWLPAAARSLPFGPVSGFATTDGTRIYRADTEPAGTRRGKGPPGPFGASIDLDPAGLGGFQTDIDDQPAFDPPGWFSVQSIGPGGIRTRYHHTTARPGEFGWLYGDASQVSRAVVDGGAVAVSAAPVAGDRDTSTRFGALIDGSDKVVNLTKERGLRCPSRDAVCRIIAWPDGTLTTAP